MNAERNVVGELSELKNRVNKAQQIDYEFEQVNSLMLKSLKQKRSLKNNEKLKSTELNTTPAKKPIK